MRSRGCTFILSRLLCLLVMVDVDRASRVGCAEPGWEIGVFRRGRLRALDVTFEGRVMAP